MCPPPHTNFFPPAALPAVYQSRLTIFMWHHYDIILVYNSSTHFMTYFVLRRCIFSLYVSIINIPLQRYCCCVVKPYFVLGIILKIVLRIIWQWLVRSIFRQLSCAAKYFRYTQCCGRSCCHHHWQRLRYTLSHGSCWEHSAGRKTAVDGDKKERKKNHSIKTIKTVPISL